MAKKFKKVVKKPSLPKVETEEIKKTKIRVIGIGGGGGNIVSELSQKVGKATFFAANTDLKALKQVSRKVKLFPFGQSFTQGLGTGMNPDLAERAAQNEKEKIKKLFQGQDLVILIACLGGGVGSGATPVFAKLAKTQNCLSYGIFTLPFKFEGEKKMEIAKEGLKKIRSKLNAITILPNERIFQLIDKNTPLKEALSSINKNLALGLRGLIEIIYQPGLINIDFADLRTILEGWGRISYLNMVEVPRGEGATEEAIEKVLNSPLSPYGIKGAKGILYNIAGQKELNLEEVSQISKNIVEKAHKEAKIIFGISQGERYQNIIKTTIFATGLSTKIFSNEIPKKPAEKKEKVNGEVKPLQIKKIKKARKVKIKVVEKPKEKVITEPPVEVLPPEAEVPPLGEKIRKSALQIKKEAEEMEKEMLEKEKFWETPAFLRRKKVI